MKWHNLSTFLKTHIGQYVLAYINYIMHVCEFKLYIDCEKIKAVGGPLMFVILKVTEIQLR